MPDDEVTTIPHTGEADGFERLWVPHRMAYIGGENRPADTGAGPGCPFCSATADGGDDSLVITTGETCFVVMNLYPYNAGHLLVCPRQGFSR